MLVSTRNRALATLACFFTAAFTAQPLIASAQTSTGTVLFWRPMSGMVNGAKVETGRAIFSIGDDGSGQRQLTPWARGVFNVPGGAAWWPVNAFSPSGRYSLFLQEHSDLAYPDPTITGKYLMMDAAGEPIGPLFPGSNDLQAPSDGPGYGSVTWGPAGTNQIAYANAPDLVPRKHPACVRLMHPDGSGDHKLWCAPRWDYRAIEALRWSGDGRSLLAYAVRSSGQSLADLYLIDTATGAATVVDTNLEAPYNDGDIGDLSYDGHEVVYQVTWNTHSPGPCSEAASASVPFLWCAKNMVTGQVVPLADPANQVGEWIGQSAMSPDGSQVVVEGGTNTSSDLELYVFDTRTSALRKITSPCVDNYRSGTAMYWNPIRFSPDGKQVLANCFYSAFQYPPPPGTGSHKIYVVNPADGSARFVTYGRAYDWHVPSI